MFQLWYQQPVTKQLFSSSLYVCRRARDRTISKVAYRLVEQDKQVVGIRSVGNIYSSHPRASLHVSFQDSICR